MSISHQVAGELDLLVIGAHPDDAELYAGGTIALLAALGRRVGVLDLTRGERATRGSAAERAEEAAAAAQVLGLAGRWNLGLPDAGVLNNEEQRLRLVGQVRALRPRLIVSHWPQDRHPDHNQAHAMVADVLHLANVGGLQTEAGRFRPSGAFWFPGYCPGGDPPPTFIVDISDFFERKIQALRCYRSQLAVSDFKGEPTMISSPAFLQWIEARARFYGHRIGVEFGEPFVAAAPLATRDPLSLFPEL
ncbi:MAG: bacillithiol biosynthesis deacetylase BshB1 [Candidatus Sumerlaeia bacterium]